jgi:hypothetical protein
MVKVISEFSLLTSNVVDQTADDSFGPVTPVGNEPWAAGFPHTPWFDMSQYYITAFKTGSYPTISVRIPL